MKKPKYNIGDKVWLGEFDNGDEIVPRQMATVLDFQKRAKMYICQVQPEYEGDDGLRELDEDQIEGTGEKSR